MRQLGLVYEEEKKNQKMRQLGPVYEKAKKKSKNEAITSSI